MSKLSDKARDLLANAVTCYGWHIEADTIIAAAQLLERNLVKSTDDYEGPRIYPTPEGIAFALRTKIVVKSNDDYGNEFRRPVSN